MLRNYPAGYKSKKGRETLAVSANKIVHVHLPRQKLLSCKIGRYKQNLAWRPLFVYLDLENWDRGLKMFANYKSLGLKITCHHLFSEDGG